MAVYLRTGLCVLLLALGGCKLYMAAHTDDFGLIATGTGDFDVATKTMPFQMTYEGLGITCVGTSHERTDGVKGLTGGYTCSDGRKGTGKSKLTGMDNGTGYFDDNCGNHFEYVWGVNQVSIEEAAIAYRKMTNLAKAAAADKCSTAPAAPRPTKQAAVPRPAGPGAAPRTAREKRLVELKQLYERGLIDKEEFKAEKQAVLRQMFRPQQTAPATAITLAPSRPMDSAEIPNVEFGNYFALVIGSDDYQHLPKLRTAVNDAKSVARLLEGDYGFNVTLLLNASRAEIIESLDRFTEILGADDNFLIYYAGHGWLDSDADRGYWLPVDAKPNRRTNWVSNATLTDTLRTLQAKHVMVVADSCFSGTLTRSANIGVRAGDYWRRMAGKWARVALVSGGLEPVSDGSGDHSPFADAFVSALRSNTAVIDGTQLFEKVRRPVMTAAKQTPQYSDVRQAGHDGGDFLFVRKK